MTPVLVGSPDHLILADDLEKWSRPQTQTTQVLSCSIQSSGTVMDDDQNETETSGCPKWKLALLTICLASMLSGSITGFALHITGVVRRSFAVPYNISANSTKMDELFELECHCRNLDGCISRQSSSSSNNDNDNNVISQTVKCDRGQVCGTSIDRQGVRMKGCIKDRGFSCEFIYMADHGAMKPRFSRIENDPLHHRRRRQRRQKIAHYHFCYCRTNGCNSGNECKCDKISSSAASVATNHFVSRVIVVVMMTWILI